MLVFSQAASEASSSKPQQDIGLALASGYRNNCGLHSIMHLWLALPEETIIYLYVAEPIFKTIISKFNNDFGLGEPDIEKFMRLMNFLNSPWDREILLGSVFRDTLREIVLEEIAKEHIHPDEMEYLVDNRMIQHNFLKLLTERMHAHLTVYNQVVDLHEYELPIYEYAPKGDKLWQADLYFNGSHFDFNYPCKQQNVEHNAKRGREHSILLRGVKKVGEGQKITDELEAAIIKKIVVGINQRLHPTPVVEEKQKVKIAI
ncbi:MAG: hypothetical protein HYX61_09325 [Gammaproteobacteria bacterium]|jgi:hypothetical protein|nr:hypothetical protein [Gammaproteobacteria bacterium]